MKLCAGPKVHITITKLHNQIQICFAPRQLLYEPSVLCLYITTHDNASCSGISFQKGPHSFVLIRTSFSAHSEIKPASLNIKPLSVLTSLNYLSGHAQRQSPGCTFQLGGWAPGACCKKQSQCCCFMASMSVEWHSCFHFDLRRHAQSHLCLVSWCFEENQNQ